jgi:hypothetical protein
MEQIANSCQNIVFSMIIKKNYVLNVKVIYIWKIINVLIFIALYIYLALKLVSNVNKIILLIIRVIVLQNLY